MSLGNYTSEELIRLFAEKLKLGNVGGGDFTIANALELPAQAKENQVVIIPDGVYISNKIDNDGNFLWEKIALNKDLQALADKISALETGAESIIINGVSVATEDLMIRQRYGKRLAGYSNAPTEAIPYDDIVLRAGQSSEWIPLCDWDTFPIPFEIGQDSQLKFQGSLNAKIDVSALIDLDVAFRVRKKADHTQVSSWLTVRDDSHQGFNLITAIVPMHLSNLNGSRDFSAGFMDQFAGFTKTKENGEKYLDVSDDGDLEMQFAFNLHAVDENTELDLAATFTNLYFLNVFVRLDNERIESKAVLGKQGLQGIPGEPGVANVSDDPIDPHRPSTTTAPSQNRVNHIVGAVDADLRAFTVRSTPFTITGFNLEAHHKFSIIVRDDAAKTATINFNSTDTDVRKLIQETKAGDMIYLKRFDALKNHVIGEVVAMRTIGNTETIVDLKNFSDNGNLGEGNANPPLNPDQHAVGYTLAIVPQKEVESGSSIEYKVYPKEVGFHAERNPEQSFPYDKVSDKSGTIYYDGSLFSSSSTFRFYIDIDAASLALFGKEKIYAKYLGTEYLLTKEDRFDGFKIFDRNDEVAQNPFEIQIYTKMDSIPDGYLGAILDQTIGTVDLEYNSQKLGHDVSYQFLENENLDSTDTTARMLGVSGYEPVTAGFLGQAAPYGGFRTGSTYGWAGIFGKININFSFVPDNRFISYFLGTNLLPNKEIVEITINTRAGNSSSNYVFTGSATTGNTGYVEIRNAFSSDRTGGAYSTAHIKVKYADGTFQAFDYSHPKPSSLTKAEAQDFLDVNDKLSALGSNARNNSTLTKTAILATAGTSFDNSQNISDISLDMNSIQETSGNLGGGFRLVMNKQDSDIESITLGFNGITTRISIADIMVERNLPTTSDSGASIVNTVQFIPNTGALGTGNNGFDSILFKASTGQFSSLTLHYAPKGIK